MSKALVFAVLRYTRAFELPACTRAHEAGATVTTITWSAVQVSSGFLAQPFDDFGVVRPLGKFILGLSPKRCGALAKLV